MGLSLRHGDRRNSQRYGIYEVPFELAMVGERIVPVPVLRLDVQRITALFDMPGANIMEMKP